MSQFDIVLLIILGGFGLFGLYSGFIRSVGSLFGSALSVFLSIRIFEPAAAWLSHMIGWDINLCRVIAFIFLFLFLSRLVNLVFWLVEKLLKVVIRVPFVRSVDRILGLSLGLLEGVLALGIVFYFVARYPISDWIMKEIAMSQVVPVLIQPVKVLMPLLPEAFKLIKSTVQNVM